MSEQVQAAADPVRQRARELAEEHFYRQALREQHAREREAREAEEYQRAQEEAAAFEAEHGPWVPMPDPARPGKSREGWEVGRSGMVRQRSGLMERLYPPADERNRLLNQIGYWRVVTKRAADRFNTARDLLMNGWEAHNAEVKALVPLGPDGQLPDPGPNGRGYLEALRKPHAEASACVAALQSRFDSLPETLAARQSARELAEASDAEEAARQERLNEIGSIGLTLS